MAVYRAVMGGLGWGQVCQNVVHFEKAGAWLDADAQTLAQHLRDNWLTQIRTRQTTSYVWNAIVVYDRLFAARQPISLVINVQGTQTNFSTQMVPMLATLMRFRTSQTGPTGRGRIYIPGLPLGDYTNGLMTQAAATAWQTILNALGPMYTSLAPSSGFNLVLSGKQAPSDTLNVTTIEMSSKMGVQRRRNIGVGI